jgi:hypothetical protein
LSFFRLAALRLSFVRSRTGVRSLSHSGARLANRKKSCARTLVFFLAIPGTAASWQTNFVLIEASALRSWRIANEQSRNEEQDEIGGSGKIRTSDLTLIRGAL